MDILSSPEKVMKDALRYQLRALLNELSVIQRKQFTNIYKCTEEVLPEDKVIHAIEMCQRTVRRNRDEQSRALLQCSRQDHGLAANPI